MGQAALQDRSIVIIGGTTGLGLSAAKACVRAGAAVVVCGRNAESVASAASTLGTSARVFVGDATNPTTADSAIQLAMDAFGRFDALYHVAGGSGRKMGDGPLHEVTDAGVEDTLRLNLVSLIYSNRAAARAFLERGNGGSVLNMGSVLGYSPSPHFFATHIYAAAKSAIIGFTQSCAAYYAPHSIRFNVIAPALVDTPMAQRAVGNDKIEHFIRKKQPLDGGRFGRPEDLDAAVVYFLSDESRYVTGQVLAVDGGWSVSEGGERDG
jgi:NAD(P)-dependent dehydrogenase (short-subunit alcohol dehydrogenase family)